MAQRSGSRRFAFALLLTLFVGVTMAIDAQQTSNPIQTENALPGTTDWGLTNPAANHEIEGYASATSVNRGSQISFFVNTTDPSYTI